MTSDRVIKVGLLWHSLHSENLGVGALTIANASLIGDAIASRGITPEFRIFGGEGSMNYERECHYKTKFINVGYKGLARPKSNLRRAMSECDLFFDIGGGDSFSDIYKLRRFGLIVGSKLAVARSGRSLIFSPQTIGPFYRAASRRAARLALGAAEIVFARDELSFEKLRDLGFANKSKLSTDVAFALPYIEPDDKLQRNLSSDSIAVGLNVSALLYRRELKEGDQIKLKIDYRSLTHRLIFNLLQNTKIKELHLVPHVLAETMPYEDDYDVAIELKKMFPQLVLPPRFNGPSEAKSYIANLDFLIGARMHATIAALSSNTAVLPLGYSRKFSGLFGSLGYQHMIDLTQMTEETAIDVFERTLQNIANVAVDTYSANERAQQRLGSYRQFLDSYFDSYLESKPQ